MCDDKLVKKVKKLEKRIKQLEKFEKKVKTNLIPEIDKLANSCKEGKCKCNDE